MPHAHVQLSDSNEASSSPASWAILDDQKLKVVGWRIRRMQSYLPLRASAALGSLSSRHQHLVAYCLRDAASTHLYEIPLSSSHRRCLHLHQILECLSPMMMTQR